MEDSREDNMGNHCCAHLGHHYVMGSNKAEDSYRGFDLSHYLDSLSLVVVDNMVGTSNGGSLGVDMKDKTYED